MTTSSNIWPKIEIQTSNENTNEKIRERVNDIKERLVDILVSEWILLPGQKDRMLTLENVDQYLKDLYIKKEITEKQFRIFNFKSWRIKIWEYLVIKWYISKDELLKALQLQIRWWKSQSIWEILRENDIISYEKIVLVLEELWIIRIWEYLIKIWKINHAQLRMYLTRYKNKYNWVNKIPLWQFLVEIKCISNEELWQFLKDLWISKKITDFNIDESKDFYDLKPKNTKV